MEHNALFHVKKGDITDSIADEVIGALQPGITEIMNKPPMSLLGKRKWIPSHIGGTEGRGGMVQ